MKFTFSLLAFFILASLAWAQPNPIGVTFQNPTGLACQSGQGMLYAVTGAIYTCQNGVFATASVAAGGLAPFTTDGTNVTLPSGTLTVGNTVLGAKTIGAGANQLPVAASGNSGWTTIVTDGANHGDCTVGNGSTAVLCRSSGSAWVPLVLPGEIVTSVGPTVLNTAALWGTATSNASAAVANEVYVHEFTVPIRASFTGVRVGIQTGSGTCSGTCGARFAIWDAAGTTLLSQTAVVTSGGSPNLNTTGWKDVPLVPAITLGPGMYRFSWTTDSTALIVYRVNYDSQAQTASNTTTTIMGTAANNSTGAGASIAFQSSLGSLTPGGGHSIFALLFR